MAWLVGGQNPRSYLEAVFESIRFLVIFFLLKVCRKRQCRLVECVVYSKAGSRARPPFESGIR